MPDTVKEAISLAALARSLVVGVVGSGVAMATFFNRFQSKSNCKTERANYEILQESRRETQAADLRAVVAKQGDIHEALVRIEGKVDNLYVPKGKLEVP